MTRGTWLAADTTKVELEPYGETLPDGQRVTEDGAIVLKGEGLVAIEGGMSDMQVFAARMLRCVQPHRHSELERLVGRAKAADARDTSDAVTMERYREALDVALTILGREDLR